jgi:hypothetical protein
VNDDDEEEGESPRIQEEDYGNPEIGEDQDILNDRPRVNLRKRNAKRKRSFMN